MRTEKERRRYRGKEIERERSRLEFAWTRNQMKTSDVAPRDS